jgi:hypothetical protein
VDRWFDASAFGLPQPFTWGNAGAYLMHDDGWQIFDVSIAKKFRIVESQSLELRGSSSTFPTIQTSALPVPAGTC